MREVLRNNRYTNNSATRWLLGVYRRLRVMLHSGGMAGGASAAAGAPVMPDWLLQEMKALAALEPELLPAGGSAARYAYYAVPMDIRPGDAYATIAAQVGHGDYTHVFVIPWLKPGGADRGILYHVRAIAESRADARVLVLSTENADSPWADRLPASVVHVAFGRLAAQLDFNLQVAVMVRLLVQLRPEMVHLVNSRVAWEALRHHGLALTQHTRWFASLFCDDYDEHMVPVGYARDYLRYCYPYLQTVMSDNSSYPQLWSRELGVPTSSFTVMPFPYDGGVDENAADALTRDGADRVLWAGRLDRQKRPDLLAAIAARLPDVHFDVYGAQVMTGAAVMDLGVLRGLPNVTLHGEFKRLEAVVSSEHFAYLHTTGWEGTPTILFDVAAARLPICAPAVGGIQDFLAVDDMVANNEDIDSYVADLLSLRRSSDLRDARVARQLGSLRRDRRWSDFTTRLVRIRGYCAP